MLGFAALVLKEVSSGDSFWEQLASGGGGSAILLIIAILAASFAPFVTGSVRHQAPLLGSLDPKSNPWTT